jgi:phage terminase large subunit-like protein
MRNGVTEQLRLKMFLDENPPNKGHWTYKLFIDHKEPEDNKPLKNPEDYASLRMNPIDNEENLPDTYLKGLEQLPARKRKRFWEGLFADDSENALWTTETIEKHKVDGLPEGVSLVRVVVPVDPSGASDDENENNDDIGIGVAGLGSDGIGYVLEDLTLNAGPAKWGKVAASAYQRHKADRVVGESNYGGAMVEFVVKTADPNISYKSVTASRGKVVRAEPISALHEVGKIKFVGDFPDLEDELCGFTTTGYIGERSPNRADWFIWGMTELFPGLTKEEPKEPQKINIPSLKRL